MSPFVQGTIYVLVSAFGFGFLPIFALLAYQGGANVSTVLVFRFVLAAACFFAYLLWRRQRITITRKQMYALLAMGAGLYTLQSLSYFSAVKYIPASLASLCLYTFPVFVALLSFWIDKEHLSKKTLLAIGIAILGLVLVLGTSMDTINLFGTACALAAALFYSVYIVLGNRVVKGVPPVMMSGYITLFATCSMLVVGISGEGISIPGNLLVWGGIWGVVLFSTVLAVSCFFRGLQMISSTKASVLSTIEPVVTILFSAILLGERMTWLQLVGGLVVLIGASLIVATRGQEQALPSETGSH